MPQPEVRTTSIPQSSSLDVHHLQASWQSHTVNVLTCTLMTLIQKWSLHKHCNLICGMVRFPSALPAGPGAVLEGPAADSSWQLFAPSEIMKPVRKRLPPRQMEKAGNFGQTLLATVTPCHTAETLLSLCPLVNAWYFLSACVEP